MATKWKTYTAEDIAQYFLSLSEPDDNDLSNLKLQKLCYYAQGLTFCLRGKVPLFKEQILAWDHGPVVPELYHKFKLNGANPITPAEGFNVGKIDQEDKEVLNEVYDYYGQFSAYRLRNMTHEEPPWRDAYQRDNKVITHDELFNHFCPKINDEFREQVYEQV